jgi:hypothetical protein
MKKCIFLLFLVSLSFHSFSQDDTNTSQLKSDVGFFKEPDLFIIDSFEFKGNKEVYLNKLKTWSKKYTTQFNNRITQESNRLRDNFQFNENNIDGEIRMIVQQSINSTLVGCSLKFIIKDSIIKYRFNDFKWLSSSLVGSISGDPKLFNGQEIGVNYFDRSGTRRFLLKLSDQIEIINKSIKKELLSNDEF